MKVVIALLTVATATMAGPVSAFTYAWSFTPGQGSVPGPYAPVTGTITGLHEGDNDGWNVTATVTSNPFPVLNGGYVFAYSQSTVPFIVQNNLLTFARGAFVRDDESGAELYFALDGRGLVQNWLTEEAVYSLKSGNGASPTGDMKFVLTSVPEPATWFLMIAGFGMTGFTMRRRIAAKIA